MLHSQYFFYFFIFLFFYSFILLPSVLGIAYGEFFLLVIGYAIIQQASPVLKPDDADGG